MSQGCGSVYFNMKRLKKNTKTEGNFRVVVFPSTSSECRYTAACIDFAIVREGDDAFKLHQEIINASIHYLVNVQKNNLDDRLLNQTLPKKYLNAYKKQEEAGVKKPIKSPIPIGDLKSWQNKSHVTA